MVVIQRHGFDGLLGVPNGGEGLISLGVGISYSEGNEVILQLSLRGRSCIESDIIDPVHSVTDTSVYDTKRYIFILLRSSLSNLDGCNGKSLSHLETLIYRVIRLGALVVYRLDLLGEVEVTGSDLRSQHTYSPNSVDGLGIYIYYILPFTLWWH